MLPVVLYGCETWSLTLREEYGQIAEENIWTEDGDSTKMHDEVLHNLYVLFAKYS
jgi:hypothetical protein